MAEQFWGYFICRRAPWGSGGSFRPVRPDFRNLEWMVDP